MIPSKDLSMLIEQQKLLLHILEDYRAACELCKNMLLILFYIFYNFHFICYYSFFFIVLVDATFFRESGSLAEKIEFMLDLKTSPNRSSSDDANDDVKST